MEFEISKSAVMFYKQEMNLSDNDIITFFVRIGGVGSGGFSAGIKKGLPDGEYMELDRYGLRICIANEEIWYFDGMTVDFNQDSGEMQFTNNNIKDVTNPH